MGVRIAFFALASIILAPITMEAVSPPKATSDQDAAALVVRGNFKKASDALSSTPSSEAGQKLKETLGRILSLDNLVADKFKADVGKRVVVPTSSGFRAGILQKVKDGVLKIKIEKSNVSMIVPVKVRSLLVPFKIEKAGLTQEEKNIILGTEFFKRGEYVAAENLFARTGPLADILSEACRHENGYVTQLMVVCKKNDLDGLSQLLEEGADPNGKCAATLFNTKTKKQTRIITTVLVEAVKSGNSDMVKALVGKGAKVNQPNSKGISPLMFAIWHFPDGDPIIDFFLEHKSNPNNADNDGNTPLSGAIALHKTKTAEKLLKHGANPNKTIRGGITPLMLAVMSNNLELTKKLIAEGADIHVRTDKGWTVLDLNRSKLSPGMKALLNKYAPQKPKPSRRPPVQVLTR